MKIERAIAPDISEILDIYASARSFMGKTGNPSQWGNLYPSPRIICADIEARRLFKIVDEGKIYGVFAFFIGEDPTYAKIYGGEWSTPTPCGIIHRVAVHQDARGKGVASAIFGYCEEISSNIRIDTHRDNLPMRRALLKFGFKERGIIYLANGDERIAFDYKKEGEEI